MGNLHKEVLRLQEELCVPKNQKNTYGNYNFRSCEDILESAKPLLKEMKLTLTFKDDLVQIGDRYYIKATAILSDGEVTHEVPGFAREADNQTGMQSAQITGSTSSYARKYALNSMFRIDDTKDPDFTNKHGKDAKKTNKLEPPKQNVPISKKCSDLAEQKFKDPDEYKAWRIDNELVEVLKGAKDSELTKLYFKLKEIK